MTANTNASSGVSYQWNINNVPISGATNNTYTATQSGYYSVTVFQSGCPINSSPVNVSLNLNPPAPIISASGVLPPCSGGSVTLTASPITGASYLWNTGQTGASITVSQSGNYFVTASFNNSTCSSTSAPYSLGSSLYEPAVCMVTVDSLSTHNIVVWEKTNFPASVDSIRIYRETMTNVFSHIGTIPTDSLSVFHDYSANPNTTSYRYKIASANSCGGISALSAYHETIHLQYFGLGNLQWTLYDIEAAGNPVIYYVIYRDDSSTGNYQPLSSTIPGGNTTYTDVNFSSFPNASYYVEVAWSISCNPSRTINITRSNVVTSGSATSVKEITEKDNFLIFPNPSKDFVNISFNEKPIRTLTLMDASGRLVRTFHVSTSKAQLSLEGLESGLYFISTNENNKVVKRIVKE